MNKTLKTITAFLLTASLAFAQAPAKKITQQQQATKKNK